MRDDGELHAEAALHTEKETYIRTEYWARRTTEAVWVVWNKGNKSGTPTKTQTPSIWLVELSVLSSIV
jgi:hypothetical protein